MSQSLLICAYRSLSVPTHDATISVLAGSQYWTHHVKYGDALIDRSRAVVTSAWYRLMQQDDVFLMVDDDMVFTSQDADRLVTLCRSGYDIISAPVPTHNGGTIACRPSVNDFSGDHPLPMEYVGAAFMAVHRRVIDAVIQTVPLCHPSLPIAFWPIFQPFWTELDGEMVYLSEDWAFVHRAREAGFKVWLEPTLRVGHKSEVVLTVDNMDAFHNIFGGRWGSG